MASTNRYAALSTGQLKSVSPPLSKFPDSEAPEVSEHWEAAAEEGWEIAAAPKKQNKKPSTSDDEVKEMDEEVGASRVTDVVEDETTRENSTPLPLASKPSTSLASSSAALSELTGEKPKKKRTRGKKGGKKVNKQTLSYSEAVDDLKVSEDIQIHISPKNPHKLDNGRAEPFSAFIDLPASNHADKPGVVGVVIEPSPSIAFTKMEEPVFLQPTITRASPEETEAEDIEHISPRTAIPPSSSRNGGIVPAKKKVKRGKKGGKKVQKRDVAPAPGGLELGAGIDMACGIVTVVVVAAVGVCVGFLLRS
jgi:hypothetical protein